jgi:hypothetical protein
MGHMKKLLTGSALSVMALMFMATPASAREGSVDLTSGTVSCKGVSIYQDSNYKVTGRCDGLVYPYETTYNKYVLWGKTTDNGQLLRIAEIDRGYFSGNIASPFNEMYITAEQNSLVRKASDKQIVSGRIAPFDFDKSKETTVQANTPSATNAPASNSKASTSTATTGSTTGAVIGKIVTSLLVVILIVVGLAIGASLLFRSRGSVSA